MKKGLASAGALALLGALFTGCSSSGDSTDSGAGSAADQGGGSSASAGVASAGGSGGEPAEIHVFSFKVDIADQFNEMTQQYEKEHPNVKIVNDVVGGSADWKADLKTRFASGNGPDIFVVDGPSMLNLWKDRIVDLSDQPWLQHALPFAKDTATIDGKVYGMPYNIEGMGLVYNKDFFADAGIAEPPTTLTELAADAQKLKDAGHTPFGNGYGEWWVLGMHQLNIAFAQQDNPDQFMQDLTAGKATMKGNPIFADYKNFLDLTLKYGSPNPLTTDVTTQENMLSAGEAAIIHQGFWVDPTIHQVAPDMKLGIMPLPINDDKEKMDRIEVGLPLLWVVNKDSKHIDIDEDFLNWMVSSEVGQTYLGEKFGFIPAYDNIEATGLGDLGKTVAEYSKAGKTIPWSFNEWPDGAYDKFFAIEQGYIGKQYDYDSMLDQLDAAWKDLSSK